MTGRIGYKYRWNSTTNCWQIGSPSGHVVFETQTLTDVVRMCRILNASLRRTSIKGRAKIAARRAAPTSVQRTTPDSLPRFSYETTPRATQPTRPVHFHLARRRAAVGDAC